MMSQSVTSNCRSFHFSDFMSSMLLKDVFENVKVLQLKKS